MSGMFGQHWSFILLFCMSHDFFPTAPTDNTGTGTALQRGEWNDPEVWI
jgi:hypothetical protein